MTIGTTETSSAAGILLEKVPLETYVPPAKPSLIGLSRAEIADRLGEIGVAPSQRKMRTQQLWHWIYFRGAKTFDEMTSVSKEMRAEFEGEFAECFQVDFLAEVDGEGDDFVTALMGEPIEREP